MSDDGGSEPDIQPAAIVKNKGRQGTTRPGYRACLLCSYIQSSPDWRMRGCPNCDDVLNTRGDVTKIKACTSVQFDGVIAMLKPSESWVAKWQRLGNFTKGLYATRVIGRLPEWAIIEVTDKGFTYVSRDDVAAA